MAFSENTFIKYLKEGERLIQIRDSSLTVMYTIEPFSISNTFVSNNLLVINTKNKSIKLDFSTSNEARLALVKLQSLVDDLKENIPFFIPKEIENFVNDEIEGVIDAIGIIQGPQGFDGIDGAQGPQGLQGTNGTIGVDGVQGPQGLVGVGIDGPQGLKGLQGNQGAQGLMGPVGILGPQGFQGISGIEGIDGVQGPQGLVGISGNNGGNVGQWRSGDDTTISGTIRFLKGISSHNILSEIEQIYVNFEDINGVDYQTVFDYLYNEIPYENTYIQINGVEDKSVLAIYSLSGHGISIYEAQYTIGDILVANGNIENGKEYTFSWVYNGSDGPTGPQGLEGSQGPNGINGNNGGNTGQWVCGSDSINSGVIWPRKNTSTHYVLSELDEIYLNHSDINGINYESWFQYSMRDEISIESIILQINGVEDKSVMAIYSISGNGISWYDGQYTINEVLAANGSMEDGKEYTFSWIYNGSDGPVGNQGPQGPGGPQGELGPQGLRGNNGLVGPQGPALYGVVNYEETRISSAVSTSLSGVIIDVTITTGGNPVYVTSHGDARAINGGANVVMNLTRDGIPISNEVQIQAAGDNNNIGYNLVAIDNVPAGTYTYALYVNPSSRFNFGDFSGPSIHVYEMGGMPTDDLSLSGNLSVGGYLDLKSTSEFVGVKSITTNTVYDYDFDSASVFYHDSPSSDFDVNFTNLPSTDSRIFNVTLIISQGSTAYLPTNYFIDGVSVSIKWVSGTTYVGTPNEVDVIGLTMIKVGNSWVEVLGQITNFT